MSTPSTPISVVQYRAGVSRSSRCGYCRRTESSASNGMWTESLTVEDYQDLIDRGWRRSGKYCYKPVMDLTCCPQYTIRCEALKLKLSKSQKKTIKRVNRFLSDGVRDKDTVSMLSGSEKECESMEPMMFEKRGICDLSGLRKMDATPCRVNDANVPSGSSISRRMEKLLNQRETTQEKQRSDSFSGTMLQLEKMQQSYEDLKTAYRAVYTHYISYSFYDWIEHIYVQDVCETFNVWLESFSVNNILRIIWEGADPTKPPCKKAKLMRLERKRQKLELSGVGIDAVSRNKSINEKSFEQFMNEIADEPVHRLKVKLVRTATQEWKNTFKQSYETYVKYQLKIHCDTRERCTERQFIRFLSDSPLQLILKRMDRDEATYELEVKLFEKYQIAVHNDAADECDESTFRHFLVDTPLEAEYPSNGPSHGYGSFHQQYWLGDTLIAVGVIDILPKCVSAVYFFYDPDYSFLSLGTYGSLRELQLVRDLHEQSPTLEYYYMGYYIHTCPKMRYKANLSPSYLLCPETYTWCLSEKCIPILEIKPYARFNDDPDARDINACVDLANVLVVYEMVGYRYYRFRERFGEKFCAEIVEYASLVGKNCAERMYYILE